jgi:23S rRNA (adenine2030-N6)-methyltransferase
VIIDAAFEKDQSKISLDWQKIVEGLNEAQKRSPSAIYLVWYPIIKSDTQVLKKFGTEMAKLKFEKVLHATFDIGQDQEETKMHACGMFVFNAPWQLDEKLKIIMPQILQILKKNDSASFEINSLGEF